MEIYVADGRLDGREEAIVSGLHHHFGYREWQTGCQLRKLLREGWITPVIWLAALAGSNAVSRLIGSSTNPVVQVAHDGLSVLGWVSMWKPLEIRCTTGGRSATNGAGAGGRVDHHFQRPTPLRSE